MISALLNFIRFRISFFALFISVSGFLLFNPLGINAIFAALGGFFICAGSYAYNNIADKKEDLLNRRHVSPLVFSRKGHLIVLLCFLLGILSSAFLSFYSIFFAVAATGVGVIYSLFRLKGYFLIKNIYTGFGIPLIFLIGAAVFSFSNDMILYYFLVSFFLLIGSIVSDLRDYSGDKIVGNKTLPVITSYNFAKNLVYVLILSFLILTIIFNLLGMYIFLPFTALIFFAIYKNHLSFAHSCGGISFLCLTLYLVI